MIGIRIKMKIHGSRIEKRWGIVSYLSESLRIVGSFRHWLMVGRLQHRQEWRNGCCRSEHRKVMFGGLRALFNSRCICLGLWVMVHSWFTILFYFIIFIIYFSLQGKTITHKNLFVGVFFIIERLYDMYEI
jgi:hypothetical protein